MEALLLSTLFGLLTKSLFSLPVLILLILDIVALRNVWQGETRSDASKVIWTLLIFFFPVGGLILWWIFG